MLVGLNESSAILVAHIYLAFTVCLAPCQAIDQMVLFHFHNFVKLVILLSPISQLWKLRLRELKHMPKVRIL